MREVESFSDDGVRSTDRRFGMVTAQYDARGAVYHCAVHGTFQRRGFARNGNVECGQDKVLRLRQCMRQCELMKMAQMVPGQNAR